MGVGATRSCERGRAGELAESWFETPEAFIRGAARGGQGFGAVTGLNLEYHRLAINGAAKIAKGVAAILENAQETDSDRLSSLSSALGALGSKMAPQAAAEIEKGLAAAFENPQETDRYRLEGL